MDKTIEISKTNGTIKKKIEELIGDANLNLCLTCGTCSGGCPASNLMDMDPRKFLRMLVIGLDEELEHHPWVWVCTMCKRCQYACPMNIRIPDIIYYLRSQWPREERPKGILGSCDHHVKSRGGAMGVPVEDYKFVVEDMAEEIREHVRNRRYGLPNHGRMFKLRHVHG